MAMQDRGGVFGGRWEAGIGISGKPGPRWRAPLRCVSLSGGLMGLVLKYPYASSFTSRKNIYIHIIYNVHKHYIFHYIQCMSIFYIPLYIMFRKIVYMPLHTMFINIIYISLYIMYIKLYIFHYICIPNFTNKIKR